MNKDQYNHNFFMQQAIQLAEKGRARTSPNPFVGAIIVKNGTIIGRGYTQPAGKDHAEVQAIKNAGKKAKDSVMYVTLEPCCYYGRTPPCTEAIIHSKIKKVIIGKKDPNPKVNGQGIQILKDAGIEVKLANNLIAEKIAEQNEIYFTYITRKRPFVIIKNALSLDGKIATEYGDSKWISNEKSRTLVHKLRNQVDAIITGVNTVNNDNPQFTVRLVSKIKDPIRIILDAKMNINPNSYVIKSANNIRTILVTGFQQDQTKKDFLQQNNVEVWKVKTKNNKIDLRDLLSKLYENEISSVMVEAGSLLVTEFFRERLYDKVYFFIASKIFGSRSNRYSLVHSLDIETVEQAICFKKTSWRKIDCDMLFIGYPY